jgi:hypothetical protein
VLTLDEARTLANEALESGHKIVTIEFWDCATGEHGKGEQFIEIVRSEKNAGDK